ncbi:Uncharacterized protein ChrSV_5193 [Chromobacterium vaccinii]|nr:Uncharacterized protein ChrSW_5187 [Chromobacterium vaccinii]QND92648.1 Uncharacterized protein ChrSV_5193 [Chromobacterium vaccinii]
MSFSMTNYILFCRIKYMVKAITNAAVSDPGMARSASG